MFLSFLPWLRASAAEKFTISARAEFDGKNWQITNLQVKLTGEATERFGFKKPMIGHLVVLLPVTVINAVGDVVSLDKSIEELEGIVKPKKD